MSEYVPSDQVGVIPWKPIANVYVLNDGTYIVRYTRVATRDLATQDPATEAPEAFVQEDDEDDAVAGAELKPYRVIESATEFCPTLESVCGAVERAADGFFQQSRHGGNLLGILGPASVFKGEPDGQ